MFNEAAPGNYSYPWRDNFCEHRRYFVGQCPGGEGHQGQDIRPSSCKLFNDGADRCQPYQHEVVAAHDGFILRAPKQEAVYLFINSANTHVRVRYMHMNPNQLDADGILSGKLVHEGDLLGTVGNYNNRERGTTYHLHFDMQVPTRLGWVFVNPYMTLVSAYERLIGARGTEIKDGDPAPAVVGIPPVIQHPEPITTARDHAIITPTSQRPSASNRTRTPRNRKRNAGMCENVAGITRVSASAHCLHPVLTRMQVMPRISHMASLRLAALLWLAPRHRGSLRGGARERRAISGFRSLGCWIPPAGAQARNFGADL